MRMTLHKICTPFRNISECASRQINNMTIFHLLIDPNDTLKNFNMSIKISILSYGRYGNTFLLHQSTFSAGGRYDGPG
jgi:hypothetical protein